MDKVVERYMLSPNSIDRISQAFADAARDTALDHRDAIRLRLLLEDMLEKWMTWFGGETAVSFECGRKFTRSFISISVEGAEYDPTQHRDGEEEDDHVFDHLLAQSGLGFSYSYKNGWNKLTLNPPTNNPKSQTNRLLLSLGTAVLAGVITLQCPENVIAVASAIANPMFDALLGLLNTIAGPMIFLAICWGILNIGDIASIGSVARKALSSMVFAMTLVGVGTILATFWVFPMSSSSEVYGTAQGFYSIYQMFLNILPKNVVQPFSDGSMLQIIFIAVCVGVTLLILGERISTLRNIIGQANDMVELMMSVIGKMVPVFIFLSVYTLILSGIFSQFSSALYCILIVILGSYAVIALYAAVISAKYKVRFTLLIKKLWKTHLVALTTASSAAAFATNLETCEKKLGISQRVAHFAVPLGQVLFMPSGVIMFIAAAFTMATSYQVPITPTWIVTLVIVSVLLAMATSPIPGGSLTFYSALLLQMGIPTEALALLLSVDMLLDYVITACNISCLQLELVLDSAKLGMLDVELLRKD